MCAAMEQTQHELSSGIAIFNSLIHYKIMEAMEMVMSAVILVIIAALLDGLASAKYRISVATGCIPEHIWNKNMSL